MTYSQSGFILSITFDGSEHLFRKFTEGAISLMLSEKKNLERRNSQPGFEDYRIS